MFEVTIIIYNEVWNPVVGECERELHNAADRYSVAITKGGVVIGHLPCKTLFSFLAARGENVLTLKIPNLRYMYIHVYTFDFTLLSGTK